MKLNNEKLEESKDKKVLILPCSGIGKALGTVTRWTAYEVTQNLKPHDTRLLCLARLVVADDESKITIQEHPIFTIDGCPKKCATLNVEKNGGLVAKKYLMPKFLVKNRDLKLGKSILDPGEQALELAKRTARDIGTDIDNFMEESR
ncbi:hypothetical protein NEF87_004577 [Candidatus Lokiarchaeum ossiferum]|uniref:DGC domain protein n=1 Tax=Candidatus Lokiarchaeum ossiferum TaxID=2951803 RepID=A0ABY6I139_9ARCH|nr:hypothetical protein NEF87_004577 [Candidatus Lokiarchaeum sp. B-35]